MTLIKIFRKRRLRKDRSDIPSAMLPLKEIHSAVVIVDDSDSSSGMCAEAVRNFCSSNGIALTLMFVDFSKQGHKKKSHPSGEILITKRDLNWFGRPDLKKAAAVTKPQADLFICLADDDSYCIKYLACSAKARFKVGRRTFPGDPFNVVVADPAAESEDGAQDRKDEREGMSRQIFDAIINIIKQIR